MKSTAQIYLAPFQGITGQVFRACYAKHFVGVDKFFTPYLASINSQKRLPERKLNELSALSENGIPVIPQILSKDADEIIRLAFLVEQLGFKELNWNLGCPFPQVAGKKRGSGMLPYPEMVHEILEQVFSKIPIAFSIKCRNGYYSHDEIDVLVPVFNQFPIKEIIIHPRIGKQLYAGKADPEKFSTIEKQLQMPVVYNGDIFSKDDFERLQKTLPSTKCWMIGRGILSDPFLPARIKNLPVTDEPLKTLNRFVNDLYLAYRKQTNNSLATIGFMKEFWRYTAESFSDKHKVLKKIIKSKSFDEYEDAVASIF